MQVKELCLMPAARPAPECVYPALGSPLREGGRKGGRECPPGGSKEQQYPGLWEDAVATCGVTLLCAARGRQR